MTTLTTIINNAFRESGITAVGTTPDTNESAEALTILVNYINSLFFDELGEFLTSYNVGTNGITYGPPDDQTITTVVKTNSQLQCNLTGPTTLYLPPIPSDGSLLNVLDISGNFATFPLTLNGNGRTINGAASLVLNTNASNTLFEYDDIQGRWNIVTIPALGTDVSPFKSQFDDMLVIALAMRLNPRYGAETHPETIEYFNRLMKQFKRRYNHSEEMDSEHGLTCLPSNPFKGFFGFPSFSKGH